MLADAQILLAPASMELAIVEIGHLPFYNQEIEDHPAVEWTTFRERVKATNAVLFVTPEYNCSVPAVLKNALDVGSRPVVPQDSLMQEALRLANTIAEYNSPAVCSAKEAVNRAFESSLAEGILHERRLFQAAFAAEG